jgi:hypothetical protein
MSQQRPIQSHPHGVGVFRHTELGLAQDRQWLFSKIFLLRPDDAALPMPRSYLPAAFLFFSASRADVPLGATTTSDDVGPPYSPAWINSPSRSMVCATVSIP